MQLTTNEILDVLDVIFFPSGRKRYTLPPGINEVSDFNKTLDYLSSNNEKVSITIDNNRLKTNLNINQTLILKEKFFLQY